MSAPVEVPTPDLPVVLPGADSAVPDAPVPVPEISEYVRLGAVKIPRINVSENLIEGATKNSFNYGIGHVDGTAMPGEEGNSVIAAHRVSGIGMEPVKEESHLLTLVTCDPVIYLGNRPDRLIVRARLLKSADQPTVTRWQLSPV